MSNVILVGAQRRITFMINMKGTKKAKPFTFWPGQRINKCPREVWDIMLKKQGSLREDTGKSTSPLEEYLETGLLWELTPKQANLIASGKVKNTSPHGPIGSMVRPQPREPKPVQGLKHVGDINSATAEGFSMLVPA